MSLLRCPNCREVVGVGAVERFDYYGGEHGWRCPDCGSGAPPGDWVQVVEEELLPW